MASREWKRTGTLAVAASVLLGWLPEVSAEPGLSPCLAFGVLDPWQKPASNARASNCEMEWQTDFSAGRERAAPRIRNLLLSEVVDPWAPENRRHEASGTWLAAKISGLDIVDPWSRLAARSAVRARSQVQGSRQSEEGKPALPSSGL